MSTFRIPTGIAAAAALISPMGVVGTPARATLSVNGLASNELSNDAMNALSAGGSAIDNLNVSPSMP